MRICIYNVTSCHLHGGLETYCWEMGRALARRGHEVTLAAGARGGAWHGEVKLAQFPFRLEQDWPDFGHRFQRLMERLSFARTALDHVLGAGYDAVVIAKPYDFPPMWRARRRGLKAQVAFHASGTEFYFGDRRFCGVVDHWLAVSRHTAVQQEARYGRPTAVIYNGVDAERFRAVARNPELRRAWGVPASARLIVSTGRLVGWKGLRVIVSAMPRLEDDVHYLVVGSGSEAEPLRTLAQEQGVAGRVHLAGRIEHARLPELLSQADVYVQPSIGEESFGISVAEAMACGLPVLASDFSALPEVVGRGESGVLLAPGDVGAWASALGALLADPDRRRRLGAAARARVEAKFTWEACAGELEEAFRKGATCAAS
ncbi:MAG TPA: glycosyltransferase family 4 protein [Burkholderiales bacterium]|nr:glycosyltransferase family 4 protein [Burkholderiales bacterium]